MVSRRDSARGKALAIELRTGAHVPEHLQISSHSRALWRQDAGGHIPPAESGMWGTHSWRSWRFSTGQLGTVSLKKRHDRTTPGGAPPGAPWRRGLLMSEQQRKCREQGEERRNRKAAPAHLETTAPQSLCWAFGRPGRF